MLHVVVDKVEIYFAKIGFLDCKWFNLNAPGSYTPCCHSLLGFTEGVLFSPFASCGRLPQHFCVPFTFTPNHYGHDHGTCSPGRNMVRQSRHRLIQVVKPEDKTDSSLLRSSSS